MHPFQTITTTLYPHPSTGGLPGGGQAEMEHKLREGLSHFSQDPSSPHWQPKATGLPGVAACSQSSVVLGVWQATHVPQALPSCPCRTLSG